VSPAEGKQIHGRTPRSDEEDRISDGELVEDPIGNRFVPRGIREQTLGVSEGNRV
jgi:hypothetical protein